MDLLPAKYARLPAWVEQFVGVVADVEGTISTVRAAPASLRSDAVLQAVAAGLIKLGYAVETGKTAAGKIKRPVLFGENGDPTVSYEIDAFHTTSSGLSSRLRPAEAPEGTRTTAT
jgi:hypothetical protein